jgi:hypothetical protein
MRNESMRNTNCCLLEMQAYVPVSLPTELLMITAAFTQSTFNPVLIYGS